MAQSSVSTGAQTAAALSEELEQIRGEDTEMRLELASTKARAAQAQNEKDIWEQKFEQKRKALKEIEQQFNRENSELEKNLCLL